MASQDTAYLPVKTAEKDVNDIVDKRFLVKRISEDHLINIHSKLVCIDRSLLYIGSDNQYPHYNEEFGCWLEDTHHVDAFFKDFYHGVWETSTTKLD